MEYNNNEQRPNTPKYTAQYKAELEARCLKIVLVWFVVVVLPILGFYLVVDSKELKDFVIDLIWPFVKWIYLAYTLSLGVQYASTKILISKL